MLNCFNINRFSINVLSCIISSIFVFILIIFSIQLSKKVTIDIVPSSNISKNFTQTISQDFILEKVEENKYELNNWKIEIPRIGLIAEISEGVTQEVLNSYVGHFDETEKLEGNIGLAAHNRGYNVNYFEKIKELETGDEIFYTYNENTKKFIVKTRDIIKETDWSYLEKTEDNRLTLITCVEDLPEYRRCIQALEYKEEIN